VPGGPWAMYGDNNPFVTIQSKGRDQWARGDLVQKDSVVR
jgi:hypothetical protein